MRNDARGALGRIAAALVGLALLAVRPAPALGWVYEDDIPTRYGVGVIGGDSYHPDGAALYQVSGFALIDYDRAWNHPAPEPLRFKIEGDAGVALIDGEAKLIASVNMVALGYVGRSLLPGVRPYLEAGIGLIYTSFTIQGEGLRMNFNPLGGVGVELDAGGAGTWFAAFRLHHISNGGLDTENRGINSRLLLIGRYF